MASCFDPFGLHPKGDRHRSFGIHIHTGLANCYVCGGWNIEQLTALLLTTAARVKGKNYFFNDYDAWVWLEEKDWLPEETAETFLERVKRINERAQIPSFDESLLTPYLQKIHKSLLSPQEPNERYFTPEIIRKFKIGYCEVSKRVVIPVWDSMNRLRGVTSRAIRPDDFIRYGVGTPDRDIFKAENRYEMTLIFEKGKVLYGENHFQGNSNLLLVESPLDVAWGHMGGLGGDFDIGAMFGATLTQEQERIARNYKHVVLAFDNDNAGETGREAVLKRMMGYTQLYTFDNYGKKDLGQCTLEEVAALPSRLEKVSFSKFKQLQPME